MSRLTRIVCDNKACSAQVEHFAGEFYSRFHGMDDTPPGWYRLSYSEQKQADAATAREYPNEPLFFCSVGCVRSFDGTLKTPKQQGTSVVLSDSLTNRPTITAVK